MMNAIRRVASFLANEEHYHDIAKPLSQSRYKQEPLPDQWEEIIQAIDSNQVPMHLITKVMDVTYLQEIITQIANRFEYFQNRSSTYQKQVLSLQEELQSAKRSNRYFSLSSANREKPAVIDQSSLVFLSKLVSEAFVRYPSDPVITKIVQHYLLSNPSATSQILSHPLLDSLIREMGHQSLHVQKEEKSLLLELKLALAIQISGISLRGRDRYGRLCWQEVPMHRVAQVDEAGKFTIFFFFFIIIFVIFLEILYKCL